MDEKIKSPLKMWMDGVCSQCDAKDGCSTLHMTCCLLSFLVLDKFDERVGREIAKALKTSEVKQ